MAEPNFLLCIGIFFFFTLLAYRCLTLLCQFLLYSKVIQLYIYILICPLFFRFPSCIGRHRALSTVPCAIQEVLFSYPFSTQQCIYVNLVSQLIPHSPFPLVPIHLFSFSLSLFLFCKYVHFYCISRFHIQAMLYNIFLFLTYFILHDSFQVYLISYLSVPLLMGVQVALQYNSVLAYRSYLYILQIIYNYI